MGWAVRPAILITKHGEVFASNRPDVREAVARVATAAAVCGGFQASTLLVVAEANDIDRSARDWLVGEAP